MATWSGVYRCVTCRHGRHLTACATLIASGPVDTDGDLAEHNGIVEVDLHEDSLQCTRHPDGVIEKRVDGVWCRWWNCPRCNGVGNCRYQGDSHTYPCPAHGPHSGWRPADALAAEQVG